MRSVLILILFVACQALAAANGYEETRELTLDANGIGMLEVENGAGSVTITGVSASSQIEVTATIVVPDKKEEKALKRIEDDLVLQLERRGDKAVLKGYFEHDGGFFNFGDGPWVQLDVRMPEGMGLDVDDGSGSLEITNVRGDIAVDDGSGSLTMVDVGGNVRIEDGSGSISVRGVGGDIHIDDGSGGIKVRGVAGNVTVDDGSGSIDVSDVEQDVTIVNDGSGGLSISNVAGRVEADT